MIMPSSPRLVGDIDPDDTSNEIPEPKWVVGEKVPGRGEHNVMAIAGSIVKGLGEMIVL